VNFGNAPKTSGGRQDGGLDYGAVPLQVGICNIVIFLFLSSVLCVRIIIIIIIIMTQIGEGANRSITLSPPKNVKSV